MNKLKRNLMTQIWELYDLDSLEDAVFNNDSAEYLKDAYDLQEIKK
ncbi:conserved protein of unknown function [Tenacibaculum jejuense]|uniref:Uncharacterized protein n=1 Tax=Tenacibaculum jejuense TaxID=584609 RepID=A0A238U4I0_9FLAO|nr:conserved protein of unknown function [Tenacibaculum jejuense]